MSSRILPEFRTITKEKQAISQFSSVTQSCPTLCDPMNRSTPDLPVHHQLLKFTQTCIHRVSDAIQPSHPRLSPSPPAPNPSSIRVFSNESTLRMRWPKYWSFSFSFGPSNEYSGLTSFELSSVAQSCLTLLQPHESLHARPPCPSPTPGVHSDSRPLRK